MLLSFREIQSEISEEYPSEGAQQVIELVRLKLGKKSELEIELESRLHTGGC